MRLTGTMWLAALLLVATGCASGEAGTGSWQPLPAPTGPLDESAACLRGQRDALLPAGRGLQRVVVAVLRSDEPRQDMARRVGLLVASAERASARACEGRTALDPLVAVVDQRVGDARGALDEPTLRLVVAALREWARDLDRPEDAVIYYHARPCVPFLRRIDASLAVAEREVAGGREAEVLLKVSNRTATRVYVEHGGTVTVRGLAPGGETRRYSWGGSSADTAAAPAGGTSQGRVWVAGRPDPTFPLLPGGQVQPEVDYALAYSSMSCPTEVRVPGLR